MHSSLLRGESPLPIARQDNSISKSLRAGPQTVAARTALPAWVGCCTSCLGDSTSCARSPGSSQTVAGIFVQLFGSLSPHPHRDSPWEALLQRRQRWRREGKNERVRDTHNPCDPEYLPPGPLAHESCSSRSAVGRLQTDLGSKSRS